MKTILLLLLLNIIIIKASYSSCKSDLASYKNSLNKCKKEKNNLIQADKELRTGIYVQDDFIFEIYNNKKEFIGYTEILDTRHHYIHRLVPKVNIPENNAIFYTDRDYLGLYQFYPIGRYTKKDISLNERTISSIIIPDNYIVYLYAYDNFNKGFHKVTSNFTLLDKFNDRTISFEIVEKSHDTDYYGVIYSETNQQKLIMGEQSLLLTQIKLMYILPDYELLIFKNNKIYDIFNKNYCHKNYNFTEDYMSIKLVINKINSNNITKVILFEDIDYKGIKEVYEINNSTNYELKDTFGKVSSISVPEGYYIQLFENNNFSGSNILFKHNVNNLVEYNFNDRAKSIKIFFSNDINIQYVKVFSQTNYHGNSFYLPEGETICQYDIWSYDKCLQIKSIKIPAHYKVIINKVRLINDLNVILTKDSYDITNYFEIYIKSIIVIRI
jgi:hypothetical protein